MGLTVSICGMSVEDIDREMEIEIQKEKDAPCILEYDGYQD